jgi:hypothetical protein
MTFLQLILILSSNPLWYHSQSYTEISKTVRVYEVPVHLQLHGVRQKIPDWLHGALTRHNAAVCH